MQLTGQLIHKDTRRAFLEVVTKITNGLYKSKCSPYGDQVSIDNGEGRMLFARDIGHCSS
jgi:hypothetical protein